MLFEKRKINFTKLIERISFSQDLMIFGKEKLSYHSLRVSFISLVIANKLNLIREDKIDLYLASLLHDIGAAATEGSALLETNRDSINLQTHAQSGYEILSQIPFCDRIAEIVKDHHKENTQNILSLIIYFADEVDIVLRTAYYDNPKKLASKIFEKFKEKTNFKNILDAFLSAAQNDAFLMMLYNPDEIAYFLPSYVEERFLVLDNVQLMEFTKSIAQNFIDKKSKFTLTHSMDVAYTADSIAKNLGFGEYECNRLKTAGFLHDIGKLFVPTSILDFNGKLEGEDWFIMKSHAYYTFSFLKKLNLDEEIIKIASHHHEYLDGSGYPFGLDRTQLSIFDQILTVADIYSALKQARPYRPHSFSHAQAIEILNDLALKDKISKSIVDAIPAVTDYWEY
jgi:putative nucleotidyltransferase with HDIG domain